jgi:hypothetical protein
MRELSKKFLELFFNPNETICVSNNKYGYHSLKQIDIENPFTLQSPNDQSYQIDETQINLVAINPINGFRRDENVTAFRSFLVECDTDTLIEQKHYIDNMQLPFSICIYSGNKSLHYGIVLDTDLPNIQVWRFYAEWISNVLTKADQQNKNPTKSIRFPGNLRNTEPFKLQALVEIRNRISLEQLDIWLNKFADKKPIPIIKAKKTFSSTLKVDNIPNWIKQLLEQGIDVERNNTWFKIAIYFAGAGVDKDLLIEFLENFYTEDKDFAKREWLTTINSAYLAIDRN